MSKKNGRKKMGLENEKEYKRKRVENMSKNNGRKKAD